MWAEQEDERAISLKLETHTNACTLRALTHTKRPRTVLNGGIAGSSRLEVRCYQGKAIKNGLFFSSVLFRAE